jgi:hypothetical protein
MTPRSYLGRRCIEETQVFTVQDGVIPRMCEYRTKAEALEALGLS